MVITILLHHHPIYDGFFGTVFTPVFVKLDTQHRKDIKSPSASGWTSAGSSQEMPLKQLLMEL
jgi:hypothetical protein